MIRLKTAEEYEQTLRDSGWLSRELINEEVTKHLAIMNRLYGEISSEEDIGDGCILLETNKGSVICVTEKQIVRTYLDVN